MISFRDLHFDYNGSCIFYNISLDLASGSFHFLTGPSGSGKSTFLKLCYLDLKPTQGEGNILGLNIRAYNSDDRTDVRRRIGIVHQDCHFIEHLTIAQNIMLPLRLSNKLSSQKLRDLDELIEWVGLREKKHQYPAMLSGGERQRAALARAVIMDPDLVIADEPTGNLDWEMAKRVLYLLIQLNKMGKTILVATHDLNIVRLSKSEVSAHVLRIKDHALQMSEVEL